jgi:hypothetical protein
MSLSKGKCGLPQLLPHLGATRATCAKQGVARFTKLCPAERHRPSIPALKTNIGDSPNATANYVTSINQLCGDHVAKPSWRTGSFGGFAAC